MKTLTDFALQSKYAKVKTLRSRLEDMKKLIDWKAFIRLLSEKETNVGRPAYDKMLMLKLLFLQSWYSISDEELEFQVCDRLSFQQFLDFPEHIPDYSTVWRFREELTKSNTIDKIWVELQRQINEKQIKVEKGVIQDATFVQAEPGKTHSGMSGRGREAKTSRSKDGTWGKKGSKNYFGFKLHTKVQRGSKLIKEVAVTSANVHDSQIDLANPDDIMYRDKGYAGVKSKAKGNCSMMARKLSVRDKLRNKRISRKRCQVEHPFGTMHRSFKAGWTKLTTLARVFVQQVFLCAAYNLYRLRFLVSGIA